MRLRDLPIKMQLFLSSGVTLILLAILGATSWWQYDTLVAKADESIVAHRLGRTFIEHGTQHHTLIADTSQAVAGQPDSPAEARNDLQVCDLGSWLASDQREESTQLFPELAGTIKALEEPHRRLHLLVREIALSPQEPERSLALGKADRALEEMRNHLQEAVRITEKYGNAASARLHQLFASATRLVIAITILSILIGAGSSLFISLQVTRTAGDLVRVADDLAHGNITASSDIDQRDELGQLAGSANLLGKSLNALCTRVHGNSSTINTSSSSMLQLATRLAELAQTMAANSKAAAVAAEEMNANMSVVTSATEQTSNNVGTMAAATEEMTATISDIASGTENARNISQQAVYETTKAQENFRELGQAAERISEVTETINEIADQASLLALNATIEAARAGDAGKGFGIVATEIRELAKQTTIATGEIQERIERVQSSSEHAIAAVATISGIITTTSEIISSIAMAIQQQASTSSEISIHVNQASMRMQEITENIFQASSVNAQLARDIANLDMESGHVAAGSLDVRELAEEMRQNADLLQKSLHGYTFKTPPFDLGQIKDAHFNWKMQLTAALNGYVTISPEDICGHHQCEFGKWYDNAPESMASLELFKEIGIYHEQIHRRVVEAITLYNENNPKEARHKVQQFEAARREFSNRLDQLYMS